MLKHLYLLLIICFLAACGDDYPVPEAKKVPEPAVQDVSFETDIRPIIESKCIACHSCFDAPCQLKMESPQGLMRGASIHEVYDGLRTEAQTPTRLGIDAETEADWRALDFYSVLETHKDSPSLMADMLTLSKQYPFEPHKKLPAQIKLGSKRDNQCVVPDEFNKYAADFPLEGMPLAVSGLTDNEYALMMGWLEQGAKIDENPLLLSTAAQQHIDDWESFLNQTGKRHQLVARWLYEHLFLAHLYFEDASPQPQFFELIRSMTPSGEKIQPVATRHANQDPQGQFYYRLRPVDGSIVHKRHITFQFGKTVRQRINKLFFSGNWQVDELPGYDYADRANPFITFAAIPAKARYQFMLDHAEFFTRTFIRGPVCRGPIATDVIRDNFWVMYQDPQRDLFVTDPDYHDEVAPLLGLPGQDDELLEAGSNWDKYRDKRNEYHARRYTAYAEHAPEWASSESIWDGDGHNKNALLSIFRHFDNASVQQGLAGRVPQTLWWMDYPLLERSYYELVVNFDVFGNVAHLLQTRLYFDLIRNGAEHNFLRLIPHEQREVMLDSWYQGSGALKTHITYAPLDDKTPTAENYASKSSKDELANRILSQFNSVNAAADDPLNRCNGDNCYRDDQPDWIQDADQQLSKITALNTKQLPGLAYLPELTFLRVKTLEQRTAYSLIRNRAHSNVAFMFGESLRYQPEKDSLTVYPGIAGSYPNFIFDIPASEITAFREALMQADSEQAFEKVVLRWGVRRTHPDFWSIFHDFTAWQAEKQPLEAGIFDANRYNNL